ncbi:MAG: pyridoxamine 5'-phosphate oxidase family protein [Candidatus Acidiferrales bacterium]
MINRDRLVEFMRANPLVTAAMISPDGAPQAAILGVAVSDQLELVFDTVDNSRKFRNVQRNGRVAVVFGAAGGYKSGSHDERTVQYEGIADVPSGEELKRVQEEIYFRQFPDGRERLKWEHITYVHVRPTWMRYSNYNVNPPEIVEISGGELAAYCSNLAGR